MFEISFCPLQMVYLWQLRRMLKKMMLQCLKMNLGLKITELKWF
jgi:hypothetical protein